MQQTRRALLTGASAAAAMAVAGALTPAEGSGLPGVVEKLDLRPWHDLSEGMRRYLAELRPVDPRYFHDEYAELPPLRRIVISRDAYTAATSSLVEDLIRQLEA